MTCVHVAPKPRSEGCLRPVGLLDALGGMLCGVPGVCALDCACAAVLGALGEAAVALRVAVQAQAERGGEHAMIMCKCLKPMLLSGSRLMRRLSLIIRTRQTLEQRGLEAANNMHATANAWSALPTIRLAFCCGKIQPDRQAPSRKQSQYQILIRGPKGMTVAVRKPEVLVVPAKLGPARAPQAHARTASQRPAGAPIWAVRRPSMARAARKCPLTCTAEWRAVAATGCAPRPHSWAHQPPWPAPPP